MKKRIMTVICLVLVAFVLLVPIPLRYKDGYEVGTIVRVLGFEVYNDVREVYEGE